MPQVADPAGLIDLIQRSRLLTGDDLADSLLEWLSRGNARMLTTYAIPGQVKSNLHPRSISIQEEELTLAVEEDSLAPHALRMSRNATADAVRQASSIEVSQEQWEQQLNEMAEEISRLNRSAYEDLINGAAVRTETKLRTSALPHAPAVPYTWVVVGAVIAGVVVVAVSLAVLQLL